MPPVEGKVAIVTGASSGIGEGIVKKLVAAGMIVAGLARRVERVEALAKTLKSEKGSLSAVKCDITKEEEVKAAFKWVSDHLGPPTAVINNAGVFKPTLISNLDLEDVKLMFDTNVIGVTCSTKQALNSMLENKTEGTIININSVSGHEIIPLPVLQVYTATKYAVTALCEGLRNEISLLGANIRVTSVSPGAVESEMTAHLKTEGSEDSSSLLTNMLPASDIADCILFVLQSPQRMTISELSVTSSKETGLSRAITFTKMLQGN